MYSQQDSNGGPKEVFRMVNVCKKNLIQIWQLLLESNGMCFIEKMLILDHTAIFYQNGQDCWKIHKYSFICLRKT